MNMCVEDNMNTAIDIVVVNWNAGNQLKQCVDSIQSFSPDLKLTTIVIDNGSTDDSVDSLAPRPDVKIIKAGANLGFGKACNLGAQSGSGDYLLFLNPDAALYPDTLKKAMTYMQSPANAQVGICGIQLIDESGHIARSCTRFPHALAFFAYTIGAVNVFPRLGHFMAEWPHDQTREVDHVIGAFYLVRRAVFDTLGGFDERFFVYLEDLDFSYRSKLASWKTMYLADVQAFHAGGGTSNQVKARRLFYSLRSRLVYAFKHFSLVGAVVVFISTMLLEPLSRTAYALLRGSWSSVKETFGGYAMLWRWLPQWIFKGVTR